MDILAAHFGSVYGTIQQRFFALNTLQKVTTILAIAILACLGCLYASLYCCRKWTHSVTTAEGEEIMASDDEPQKFGEPVPEKVLEEVHKDGPFDQIIENAYKESDPPPSDEDLIKEMVAQDMEIKKAEALWAAEAEAKAAALDEIKRLESQKLDAANEIEKNLAEKDKLPDVVSLPEPKIKIVRSPHKIASANPFASWGWPEELSTLDVTVEQRQGIDAALNTVAEAYQRYAIFQVVIEKGPKEHNPAVARSKDLVIKLDKEPVKKIPIPLNLILDNQANREQLQCLLLTKKIIGSGGQRKVKICYDLTNGVYLVKKTIFSQSEYDILNHFHKNPGRGLPVVSYFREVNPSKFQALEPLYEGSLTMLFGTTPLAELEQKLSLIHDILEGLKSLHDLTFQHPEHKWMNDLIKMFHFDIKPENILVRPHPTKKNKWEAVISDFGCSGNLYISGGTYGFRAPEEVALEIELRRILDLFEEDANQINKSEVESHNRKYGQPMDIWATALVLILIITGKTSSKFTKAAIPPLPCIENCFLNIPVNANPPDKKLTDLKQHQIDQDLSNLKLPSYKTDAEKIAIEEVMKLIREMLQIDPDKRISATDTLIKFQKATAALGMDI